MQHAENLTLWNAHPSIRSWWNVGKLDHNVCNSLSKPPLVKLGRVAYTFPMCHQDNHLELGLALDSALGLAEDLEPVLELVSALALVQNQHNDDTRTVRSDHKF